MGNVNSRVEDDHPHKMLVSHVTHVDEKMQVVSKGKIIITMKNLLYTEKSQDRYRKYCEWPLKYLTNYGWENDLKQDLSVC